MKFPRSYCLALLAAARDHERDGWQSVAASLRAWSSSVSSRATLRFALASCGVDWDPDALAAHLDTADQRARGNVCESREHVRGSSPNVNKLLAAPDDPWQCPSCGAVYCRECETEGADCAACRGSR